MLCEVGKEPGWFKSAHASVLQRSLISDFCDTVNHMLENKKNKERKVKMD